MSNFKSVKQRKEVWSGEGRLDIESLDLIFFLTRY